MTLVVTSEALALMRAEARAAHPRECCGILLGTAYAVIAALPVANVDPRPETRFALDPRGLIDAHRHARAGGAPVAGYYHSHPAGPAIPSAADQAEAARDGKVWAIVAGDTVRFWRDAPDGFVALPHRVGEA